LGAFAPTSGFELLPRTISRRASVLALNGVLGDNHTEPADVFSGECCQIESTYEVDQ